MVHERSDVLILGGGLAGLTLAIQLRREFPSLTVRVLERNRHPVREAAFKVGESSVEIGAHYFDTVLGLKAHLDSAQIRKFGFRFFFSEGRDDVDRTTELGVSEVFPTPSYQIDRGIFENYLSKHAAGLGAEFLDGAVVHALDLGADGAGHGVRYRRDGAEYSLQARWLIDASGRAGLLKRKLDLAQPNGHDANAIWFRIGERIAIDEWSDDPVWRARCSPPERWRSTNHLCGPGYWAWLIPLSSGSHSVGIVADAGLHPLETIDSFDKAMAWFARHQPHLYRALDSRRDKLQDFAFLRHFSHGCKQVFSSDRWALTGDAGLFLDPFYSPGSDFIAIGNSYITALIGRDLRGERFAREARIFEQLYFSFYRNTLALYEGQYPMFGHAQLMPLKVIWDYAYYWGVLCQFFFQQRLTEIALFTRLAAPLAACEILNGEIQLLLRRAAGTATGENPAWMFDQCRLPWFAELNRGLTDRLDETAFERRIRANAAMLAALAAEILARVREIGAPVLDDLPTLAALQTHAPHLLREAA
ncbi:MAG: tryptophan 7-halogenase [Rudaea sp.]|nr:tryptophan 7-halogenase [Rudaea sp.]